MNPSLSLGFPVAGLFHLWLAMPLCAGEISLAYEKESAVWLASGAFDVPRKLTPGHRPALRPDAQVVAFVRWNTPEGTGADPVTVWVKDLASGAEKPVFVDTVVDGPVWSPDGRSLAYVPYGEPDGPAKLLIADAATGERRSVPLPRDPAPDGLWSLEWLPDGRGLGFHDMVHYWQVSLTGKVLLRLAVSEFAGATNPDGRERNSFSSADVVAVCPASPAVLGYTEDARGSPAFEKALYGEPISALLLSAASGTPAPHRLADATLTVCDFVWAPDGRSLFVCGYRDRQAREANPFRIFKVERRGGPLREIDRGEAPSVAASP